jgi:glycosyltransferase involved in cell wall biosynthesis
LNILLLDQFSDPGGAQLCLMELMPEIIRRGWSPRIMAPGAGELVKWSRRAGIPVYSLPLRLHSNGRKTARDFLRFSFDAPRMAAAVRGVIHRERVDLVYVNGPRVLPAVLGVRCPVVFHAHSSVRAGWGRKLVGWTLRSGHATVIAASEYVAKDHLRVPGGQRVRVIYNGVGDFHCPARRFRRRPVRVGIIGRIAVEKGQMDFVRAARQIAETGGDVEFFVYGERLFADARYEAQVRALALNAPVTFCGWTNDVAEALRNMEILAVPSGPGEAATRVIMEAFSAGTPVVAYCSGGIPELVEHGRTGILTDTPDFAALANSIRILIRDPGLMDRLSAAGRKEWQERFRVERFRKDICDLLESCAQSATSMRRG